MWTLRQILIGTRFALPHAIRLMLASLWMSLKLSALSIITMFMGMVVVNKLAERWTEEALEHGFPQLWKQQLFNVFRVIAFLTILTGWAIIFFTLYFTVDWVANYIR